MKIQGRLVSSVGILMIFASAVLFGAACTSKKSSQEVNLAIWANYISPETQARFEKETGIKLNISNFSSNEELLAKIQSGASGIDVAVPSEYMVEIMADLNLLENLDRSQLEHSQDIDPQFNSNSKIQPVSVPYAWTTTGLAYNKDLLPAGIKDWKTLFTDPSLKGKVSLLDDVREVAAAALKYHGYSLNTAKAEELKKAEETLLKFKDSVKMFTSDPIEALVNKEVAIAQIYSSDALQAATRSGGKIEYVIPAEGAAKAADTLVIVKGSKNKEQAVKLINFLLNPQTNVEFVKEVLAGPVLMSTKSQLPAEIQALTGLFPAPEVANKLENLVDVGDATTAYDALWTKVKTE